MRFTGIQDAGMEAKIRAAHDAAIAKLELVTPHPVPARKFVKGARLLFTDLKRLAEIMCEEMTVKLSGSMRSAAGRAKYRENTIELHHRLFQENPSELEATYIHELAHMLAHWLYNYGVGHGPEWKKLAIAMGDTGERCHSMDVSKYRIKRKRFTYVCECTAKTYHFGKVRHLKALVNIEMIGRSGWSCRDCRKPLAPATEGTPMRD